MFTFLWKPTEVYWSAFEDEEEYLRVYKAYWQDFMDYGDSFLISGVLNVVDLLSLRNI